MIDEKVRIRLSTRKRTYGELANLAGKKLSEKFPGLHKMIDGNNDRPSRWRGVVTAKLVRLRIANGEMTLIFRVEGVA